MQETENVPLHRFRNNAKAIPMGEKGWQGIYEQNALDLSVHHLGEDRYQEIGGLGRKFVNFTSCSYLGLTYHPKVLEGAQEALRQEQILTLSMSRARIRSRLHDELEQSLSDLFRARCIATVTTAAATAGVLPLIASGHLMDDGEPRVMVFDKFSHFSMNLIKPICADETTVLTAPHNDLNFVEDACKKYKRVAYVGDGAYSMGGTTLIEGLMELQDRYGLFLYLDDSHSLSVWGERGEGYVRSHLGPELNPLTIVSASMLKGFGGSGGIIMLGPVKHLHTLLRHGGPLTWSQSLNLPAMGADLASAEIHRTPELRERQQRMLSNMALLDEHVPTPDKGNGLPIRLIVVGAEEKAIQLSGEMLNRGFYTSAVFFPIVERNKAGLRIMIRASNSEEEILELCRNVRELVSFD
jgi:7-keto-8-aminopelargonate synthetase-like enzyme